MTGILTFQSDDGPIHFEVSTLELAKAVETEGGMTAKGGVVPMSATGEDGEGILASTRFEQAMASLKAYAGSVQRIVGGLDITPKEVTVEVGLTLSAKGGFFAIASAGTEAEMKVTLTWEPKSGA